MKLKLHRIFFKEYTIGKLYIDEVYFSDTLEDKVRDLSKDQKVFGQTAIPYGTYQVQVSRSPKFGRDLPRLLNVPHFDGILMHRGNTNKDTSGCILLGENKIKGMVINSTGYEVKLVEVLKTALLKEKVTIEIV